MQTKKFHFGIEILPTVILWEPNTSQGIDKDVFGPFYLLRVLGTVTFVN